MFADVVIWRLVVDLQNKVLIWDLDNTLYRITPELADMLDAAMAEALVYDLGVPLDFETAKAKVKESYRVFRDGGEVFYRDYGVSPKDLFRTYNYRNPVHEIKPYSKLAEKIKKLPVTQYVFTASNRYASEKILRKIGLYDFFIDKLFSVEDFDCYKKNESADVYHKLCDRICTSPKNCMFIDDSYSNLEMAKKAGMTTVRIFYNDNSTKDKGFIDFAYKGVNSFVDTLLEDISRKTA